MEAVQFRSILKEELNSFRQEIREYCRSLFASYLGSGVIIPRAKMWKWLPVIDELLETSVDDVWNNRMLINEYVPEVKISSRVFAKEYVNNCAELLEAFREIGFYTPEPYSVSDDFLADLIHGRKGLIKKRCIDTLSIDKTLQDQLYDLVRNKLNHSPEVMRYIPNLFITPDKAYILNIYHTIYGIQIPQPLSPHELHIYQLIQAGILKTTAKYDRNVLIPAVFSISQVNRSPHVCAVSRFLDDLLSVYINIEDLYSQISSEYTHNLKYLLDSQFFSSDASSPSEASQCSYMLDSISAFSYESLCNIDYTTLDK